MGVMLSSLPSNVTQELRIDSTGNIEQIRLSVDEWRYSGWSASLASFIFFNVIHSVFQRLHLKPGAVKDYDYWMWRNLWISWFHALVCGSWVVLNMYWYPEYKNDLILHITHSSYLMVCFSVGYFIYDFVDMWINSLIRKHWELTVHHMAITSIMVWNLYDCQRIGWNIVALSAEVNSFFLHSRKLMKLHHVPPTSALYIANAVLNLISFAVFRFGSCIWIFFGIFYHFHRISLPYFCAIVSCQFVMNVINPVLFLRLVKSDLSLLRKNMRVSKQLMDQSIRKSQ